MRWFFVSLIKLYRAIVSPLWHGLMGSQAGCRFTPGCGQYAQEAVAKHGMFRGGYLAFKRVCKCHPWNKGGVDPVP